VSSVFTKIIAGELPGTFVHRDEHAVAIMTINPINTGHVLVIPRVEVDRWTDLPVDATSHLFALAHRIGNAQIRAFGCQRSALIIAGFEVPHVHLHSPTFLSKTPLATSNQLISLTPQSASSLSCSSEQSILGHFEIDRLDVRRIIVPY
jgi:histidine triad (HIT) family protein